jgi:hypothetical protein
MDEDGYVTMTDVDQMDDTEYVWWRVATREQALTVV